ncbi:hypothetical protein [Hydrogenivirga sp. 128-5-R1-1]|uniref:hypothetical protein n=1 Tax=Hydrogenivirga sp. 128-5-R1-1 TaxID=392423 RepID=UPI00015EF891|nr:hypothetical protein [Hydrogenivirga sp. 128-5-R1-1]EDP75760.1 hypothetical protein HG1285_17390 [Hydrogenivirga sp. 128-5-R1-1]
MVKKGLLSGLIASGVLFAQPSEELKVIKEEVEVLKEELRKLKLEMSMPQITTYESYTGLGPAASKALLNPKGVSIGGYGEVWFVHNPDSKPKTKFDAYRFIIYLGYAFTERLKFNSEIEIEHAYVEGGEDSGEVALEFAFLDYRFADSFGIRGGMVLVPVGITNEYHEPPTYLSVKQPYLEKVLFPFTWRENGVGVYGETDLLEYRAYVINGMKAKKGSYKVGSPLKKLHQKGGQAAADQLAFTGRLDVKLPLNLKVGASTFITGVQDEQGNKVGTISLFSPHLWWQYAGFDVRFVGAYASVNDADKISATLDDSSGTPEVFPERMQGFYLQVAYNVFRFMDTEQELYVFAKYEDIDPYASTPSGYTKPSGVSFKVYNVGLSYKPHPLIALKTDYVRLNKEDAEDESLYNAAITWMF